MEVRHQNITQYAYMHTYYNVQLQLLNNTTFVSPIDLSTNEGNLFIIKNSKQTIRLEKIKLNINLLLVS